jgi:rhamnosyl/mannosyltransferase
VVWFHSEVVRPRWKYRLMYQPFLRRVLTLADRIVVASPLLAEHAEELQDYRGKCVAIPFGIDPMPLTPTEGVRARAREIRGSGLSPVVLAVGRMVPYKGFDILLRALHGVEARAILVGSGPLQAEWQELARDIGVADRVEFAGEVDALELAALYHACDVFVLPSVTRQEAFGMVQLEAMACGKPVISTLLPSGVPWVNRNGQTGLVVPPRDVAALRTALQTLVHDPALRARMGERGRARVEKEFTVPRMIAQTTALYRRVIEERAVAPHVGIPDSGLGVS